MRSEDEWRDFWRDFAGNLLPTPRAPEIDFERRMVLAVTMGFQRSGGYWIAIDDVFEADGVLYAVVMQRSPGPGCAFTQATTAPAAAISIDRTDAEIRFVETTGITPCD